MKCFASAVKFTFRVRFTVCCAIAVIAFLFARASSAQSVPYQRMFPQSKAIVEKRVKELQSSSAGHLPALEGFTVFGDRPLDRFHRGVIRFFLPMAVWKPISSIAYRKR